MIKQILTIILTAVMFALCFLLLLIIWPLGILFNMTNKAAGVDVRLALVGSTVNVDEIKHKGRKSND